MFKTIKKNISEINFLFDKKIKFLFILNFLFMLLVSIFEIIGIGSIFLFISIILDPSEILSKYDNFFISNYIINLDDQSRLFLLSVFLIVFFIIKGFIMFLSQYISSKFLYETKLNLSSKLFKGYLNKDYTFHLSYNPSLLNQRIINETAGASVYYEWLLKFINSIILNVCIIIILLYSSSEVGIFNVLVVSLVLFVSRFILKNTIKKRSEIRNANDVELFKTIQHAFGSFIETVLFKKEIFFVNYFNKYLRGREFQIFFLSVINSLPKIFLEVLLVTILGLFFIFFIKTSENLISVLPLLTLIVVSLIRLMPNLHLLMLSINTLKFNSVNKEIILSDIRKINSDKINLQKTLNEKKINYNDSIKFQNLSFKYNDNEKLVLRDINLQINSGEKIAIIGSSGSGKSTLVNILTGLLQPTSGNISVDNDSIFKNIKNWQSIISYIPQNIYLIDDTVEKNITFSTDEDVVDKIWLDEVLKLSNIYDDIYKLKDKTKTLVGNRGVRFSGGQKQRIAIARAIYKKPQILIMDEPTSGLDKHTEQILFKNVLSVSKNHTLIIISHNIEMNDDRFKVYELKDGIIEKK